MNNKLGKRLKLAIKIWVVLGMSIQNMIYWIDILKIKNFWIISGVWIFGYLAIWTAMNWAWINNHE